MNMELYKNCQVKDCNKKMRWGKYCSMHRARLLRRGLLGGAKPELVQHGMHQHPLYHTWENMRARCNNKNHNNYSYYGARGIKVCDRWNDFSKFIEDMGEKPHGTTLDRIDVNGDYEPNNCRWATPLEQVHNQRLDRRNKTGYPGVRYDEKYKIYRVVVTVGTKAHHIGSYKRLSDAIKARKDGEKKYRV